MRIKPLLLAAVGFAVAFRPTSIAAQAKISLDSGRAVKILGDYCAACHGWAEGYDSILKSGKLTPGNPDMSDIVKAIEDGVMPPSGPAPTGDEKAALRAWVSAGAPKPGTDAVSAATSAPAPKAGFLGFPSKAAFHRASGWTSAGLLLAAGSVGAVRAYGLMTAGHEYRDALGIDDEDQIGQLCFDEMAALWAENQALRWTHVGLLVAGEGLYLGNAITGLSMRTPGGSWPPTKSDLHRWAFYGHAGLMASEIVLGLISSDALSRGDHELVRSLGVAHAAIGVAIPVLVIGAGAVIGR